MHCYNFNIADFNNSTRHLSLPERAIYRDLIDMYYHNEQAIDSSDMERLARRLREATEVTGDDHAIKREFERACQPKIIEIDVTPLSRLRIERTCQHKQGWELKHKADAQTKSPSAGTDGL